MATMRLKYVHSFVDKTGRLRFYFRHRGKRWPLPGVPGSSEFSLRYDQLWRETVSVSERHSNVHFAPHTLGSVIEKWLASDAFTSKSSETRRQYRRVVDQLKELCGRALIADLREEHVREIRTRFAPATFTQDRSVMLLSTLWTFAKENLAMRLGANPTTDIVKLHKQSWTHEPWPNELIKKFEDEATPKPNAQLALLLLLYSGQRVGDVSAMKWDQYDGEGIEVRQQKTDVLLWIPCHSRLKATLDSAERRSQIILSHVKVPAIALARLGA